MADRKLVKMKAVRLYFKYILPLMLVVFLGREVTIFIATPNEYILEAVSFFEPAKLKNDQFKAGLVTMIKPFIANRKIVHSQYKSCHHDLIRYEIFEKTLFADQLINCLDILDSALIAAPSSPLIWLEKANLQAKNPATIDGLNKSLHNAWQVAKRQAWVAIRRIEFSLNHWQILNAENRQIAEQEFLFYAPQKRELVRILAHQYLLKPQLKNIISTWVGKSNLAVQRQFIADINSTR